MSLVSNEILIDEGSKFYSRSTNSFQQNNDIEIYSTFDEEKFVIAERFNRALKNKIYKYMNSVSKNVYIAKLDNIVNKHNNTYHSI